MSAAKIRLSPKEMELVVNADLILTKNLILQKVNQLLGSLQEKQKRSLDKNASELPAAIFKTSPKISKGENYKGLPYLILDHPRFFEGENIFAIRTMFWWGNFFSTTLHLSGIYKQQFEKKILSSQSLLKEKGFYYSVNEEQWEHHFEQTNYLPLAQINSDEIEKNCGEKKFIKVANKISVHQWHDAEEILLDYFNILIEILID